MLTNTQTNGTSLTNQLSSQLFGPPAATSAEAHAFFSRKLSFETDPADIYTDLQNGVKGFVILDVRSPAAYAQCHVQGALSLPQSTISAETTASLDKGTLLVVYCWGPGCNGATKSAVKLTALGFQVKEMIGGIEYWAEKEHYPVERSL